MAQLLVVCSGNLVRSPVAEAAFRAWGKGSGEQDIGFASAGVSAVEGQPVPADVVQATRAYFLDLHAHRSRRLTREDLSASALVLGMTESHRDTMQAMLPAATARIFTLKEFARLARHAKSLSESGGDLTRYVRAVHLERPHRPQARHPEDIADPHGRSAHHHRDAIAEIVDLVAVITERLC